MSRVIRLLVCTFILLGISHTAHASVNLYGHCSTYRANAVNGATNDCDIQSTTSGHYIIITLEAFGASFAVTGTETVTCPALAISPPNTGYFSQICYSITTTGHADFNIHTVLTCSTCSSVGLNSVEGFEVDGLTSTHDCANGAAAKTVNCTTSHAGDWGIMAGHDFSSSLAPASGFQALGSLVGVGASMNATTQLERGMEATIITGGAGSITASYTNTNSFPAPTISVIYFQTSGGVTPQVPVYQYCGLSLVAGNNPTSVVCRLYNTVTPHTMISGWYTNGGILDGGSTEVILYPANAQNRPSGTGTSEGIGYVITSSSHAVFDAIITVNGGGNAVGLFGVTEVGGNSVIDSGSEAHAAATSTAFTTAANNEQAFFNALDDAGNLMVPTNSFVPMWFEINHSVQTGLLLATRRLAVSGSYTASYTQTGSSSANIGVLAFTVTSSAKQKHKSQIIRYKPLVKPEILLVRSPQ